MKQLVLRSGILRIDMMNNYSKASFALEMKRNPSVLERKMTRLLCSIQKDMRKKSKRIFHFERQKVFCGFILDYYFAHLRLCIEVDGNHHTLRKEEDGKRDDILLQNGIKTVRFTWKDVVNNSSNTKKQLISLLKREPSDWAKTVRFDKGKGPQTLHSSIFALE